MVTISSSAAEPNTQVIWQATFAQEPVIRSRDGHYVIMPGFFFFSNLAGPAYMSVCLLGLAGLVHRHCLSKQMCPSQARFHKVASRVLLVFGCVIEGSWLYCMLIDTIFPTTAPDPRVMVSIILRPMINGGRNYHCVSELGLGIGRRLGLSWSTLRSLDTTVMVSETG